MTPSRGLYLLVDESALPYARWDELLEPCLDTGPALVQYRAKQLPAAAQFDHAQILLKACQARDIPLLINDDIELCLALGAAGAHLGRDDAGIRQARTQLGPQAILGSSCYADLERAQRAIQAGASYVSFGRLFPSLTKPDAPAAPLEILSQARAQCPVPICGIGGITADNAAKVQAAGASLVCAAGGVWQSANPVASCEKLATICR